MKRKKICIVWYNLHDINTNETNALKFWLNVSKKFNKCLISNQVPKYLLTYMENIFQLLSSKFKIQNKLANEIQK